MPSVPLSSQVDRTQHLLADLRGKLADLPPERRQALQSELERFRETLERQIAGGPDRAPAGAAALNERSLLLALLDALPIGVAIYDLAGRIIQANLGFEEVWGAPRPAAYAAGQDAYKAWWVEGGAPVQTGDWASFQAVREGRKVTNQYLEIERFDGTHRFVLNSAAPIRDALGQVAGCIVAVRDITEFALVEEALKASERSLWESEERLRGVLAALPISVFILDRDLRYTWVYSPQSSAGDSDQLLGRRDDELYPHTGLDHLADLRSVLETGQGIQREVRVEVSGEEKYFLLSYEPYRDLEGSIKGIIGAALDVTERRRLEEERRQAMEQVNMQRQIVENREKERQVIAREIHDGPIQSLVSIMFDLHLARESVDVQPVHEELDQVSARLKSAVRELRDVVNNLRPPALLRFGLGKSLSVYAEDFRTRHPTIRLDLSFDLPDDHIYFPEETTLSLYRLCQEGLNNVARHARATAVHIRFTQRGDQIVLEIHDDGCGFIVPDNLIRKTKDGHYGLAGMNERVQALGGEFHIHSSPGAGTRIEVIVPLEQPDRPPAGER